MQIIMNLKDEDARERLTRLTGTEVDCTLINGDMYEDYRLVEVGLYTVALQSIHEDSHFTPYIRDIESISVNRWPSDEEE